MAIISGYVGYDPTNTYSYPSGTPSGRIINVPVVLQNTSTNVGLAIKTDGSGNFSFTNVPIGVYRLVESWVTTATLVGSGDFGALATLIPSPTPQDPPIGQAPSPPASATRLQSLTRNTILPITISTGAENITGQNFVDAPIIETPVPALIEATIVGSNLITVAQSGQWGTLPEGAANQSIAPVEPYPGVVPSEIYDPNPVVVAGTAQRYNVTNIAYRASYNFVYWYSMTNHTTFDETSRMMIANAAGGGPASNERIFETTINILPNTFYIGFTWIANLFINNTGVPPQIGVVIRDTSNNIIFNSPTPQLQFSSPPAWVQIGGVFYTGNNTTIVVQYLSIATGDFGNDFVADDFSIYQIQLNNFLSSTKSVDLSSATVGDVLTYTVTIANPGTTTASTVFFQDSIPLGATFVPSSVVVDSTTQSTYNPQSGFALANLGIGAIHTVSFKVNAASIPPGNQISNRANITYSFSPVVGGVTVPQTVFTNTVDTTIFNYVISPSIVKSVDKLFVDTNTTLKYTIAYTNNNLPTATNIVLIDTIPNGSSFVPNSLFVNGSPVSGSPNPPGVTLPSPVGSGSTATITFNTFVSTTITNNPLINNATVDALYVDRFGNTVPNAVSSNSTVTTISSAILNAFKGVNTSYATCGDIITYTITVPNLGNATATNVIVSDTVPSGTTFVPGSILVNGASTGGTPASISIGTISPGASATTSFQVKIQC